MSQVCPGCGALKGYLHANDCTIGKAILRDLGDASEGLRHNTGKPRLDLVVKVIVPGEAKPFELLPGDKIEITKEGEKFMFSFDRITENVPSDYPSRT